ncbi:MAG: peptide ABC transporter substrate-binding protein [Eubacterium sp.]|nr:peptide ABC transporter substrate-binding protein [Eubacterium sp.]
MKKSFKGIICSVLAIVLMAGVLSSCSGKDKVIDFIYPFSADVNSYDPQVASTSDEFLIIENTFEGLIRMDDEGNIKKGVADSWEISSDKMTYTFKLKKGLKWNINTEKYEEGEKKGEFKDERLQMLGYEFNPDITAHDFVFALRRAAKPETACPLFSAISSIKNAVAVNSNTKNTSSLGVKALDDYTLQIKLAYPDESFMETLTSAVAMPCNQEFFNATKGRYGLKTKYTLFNGQFYLSQILETSYLLKKNELYLGDSPAKASELTLKISDEDDDIIKNLNSGYYDAAFINGSESAGILKDDNITTKPYINTTWALRFNKNDEVFFNKDMRHAFCIGLSKPVEYEYEYITNANNFMPSSCKIGSNNAVDAVGATVEKQNQKKSIELWRKGLKTIEANEITVKVITPYEMEGTLKELLQGIQSGISTVVTNDEGEAVTLTLKVEAMTEEEMNNAIIKGEYDIAFCPFVATSDSAISFLRSVLNTTGGYNKESVEKLLVKAEKAHDLSKKAEYIKKAEKAVIKTNLLCPLVYETGYYAEAKGVKGVNFHEGTGRISFIYATREE